MSLTNFALEEDIQSEHKKNGLDMSNQNENNTTISARKGEDILQVRFRVNRLFAIGIDWYFSTREGKDQGPFKSKESAEQAITNFIREIQV